MTDQHPITPPTPPDELVWQWRYQWELSGGSALRSFRRYLADYSSQWGWDQRGAANEAELQQRADQELEACCKWLAWESPTTAEWVNRLHAARRPKPPSLKEQALLQLDTLNADLAMHGRGCDLSQIRRALEALPND